MVSIGACGSSVLGNGQWGYPPLHPWPVEPPLPKEGPQMLTSHLPAPWRRLLAGSSCCSFSRLSKCRGDEFRDIPVRASLWALGAGWVLLLHHCPSETRPQPRAARLKVRKACWSWKPQSEAHSSPAQEKADLVAWDSCFAGGAAVL